MHQMVARHLVSHTFSAV